jgi:hypothetical protein
MAIPKDKLVYFSSDVCFDSSTIRILVQSQRCLEVIIVPLQERLLDSGALLPYLAAIKDVFVWISRDATRAADTFENYDPLLQHKPLGIMRTRWKGSISSYRDGSQSGHDVRQCHAITWSA